MIEEVYLNKPASQHWQKKEKKDQAETGNGQQEITPWDELPILEELLNYQTGFPPLSLLLGLRDDEKPIVLNLENPVTGSFLIASDNGFENTNLLHNILVAGLKGNHPYDLHLHLVSPDEDHLRFFLGAPNCRIGFQPLDPEIPIVLEEMVNLVISRKHDLNLIDSHIFAIDGLDVLWQALDPQSKLRLDWLIRNGPMAGFRIFATLDTLHLDYPASRTIDLFTSRIIGRIKQEANARLLAGFNSRFLSKLSPGTEYLLISGELVQNLHMVQSEDLIDG